MARRFIAAIDTGIGLQADLFLLKLNAHFGAENCDKTANLHCVSGNCPEMPYMHNKCSTGGNSMRFDRCIRN